MRSLDLLASAVGLIVLSPLLALIASVIKLTSPGPVFYRGSRVGKDGEPFRLYKFRSMVIDADKLGASITASGDQRITALGHLLRRTKLDELPQLINVFKGEMSLVGPRPEDPRYITFYTSEQRKILKVRPGITSAASLAYRHEEQILTGSNWETVYCSEILPAKIKLDLAYLSKRTLFSDILIILRTILSMFR